MDGYSTVVSLFLLVVTLGGTYGFMQLTDLYARLTRYLLGQPGVKEIGEARRNRELQSR